MSRSFTLPRTQDPKVDAVLTQLEAHLRAAFRAPLEDVSLIENQILGTTVQRINHSLGRRPRGWLVVRANSGASIYSAAEDNEPDHFIQLTATATITCSLLFF